MPRGLQSLVSLKPPPASWVQVIQETAQQFMTARVCFYEEISDVAPDPISGDDGDSYIRILWADSARVQHLRAPQKFATEYQAEANRAFRFQLPKNSDMPFMPQGTLARVLNAGEDGDHDLEALVFVVDSAINASFQAVETVELTSTMDAINWTWDEDTLYSPLLTVDLVGDEANLSWTDRGNIESTGFDVEVDGVIEYSDIPNTSISVSDLSVGTHSFRVRGVVDGDNTPWSRQVNVTVE